MLSLQKYQGKTRVYLEEKFNKPPTNSKYKNIRNVYRETNELKKAKHPITNLVNDMNSGGLLSDFHNNLNGWIYFSQLLNPHKVSDPESTQSSANSAGAYISLGSNY
jgi:hypothetical protein